MFIVLEPLTSISNKAGVKLCNVEVDSAQGKSENHYEQGTFLKFITIIQLLKGHLLYYLLYYQIQNTVVLFYIVK